jgi:hypothetical protein
MPNQSSDHYALFAGANIWNNEKKNDLTEGNESHTTSSGKGEVEPLSPRSSLSEPSSTVTEEPPTSFDHETPIADPRGYPQNLEQTSKFGLGCAGNGRCDAFQAAAPEEISSPYVIPSLAQLRGSIGANKAAERPLPSPFSAFPTPNNVSTIPSAPTMPMIPTIPSIPNFRVVPTFPAQMLPNCAPVGGRAGSVCSRTGADALGNKRLFVARIPQSVNHEIFHSYFSAFGAVLDAYLPRDKVSGATRGIGFVTYASPLSAQIVLNTEHTLHGNRLAVDVATQR